MDQICESRVMIVEDDQDIRDSLVEVIQDNSYDVLPASNGPDALEQLRNSDGKPCVILLDIMMPIMDGRQFRSVQREDPRLRDIPVIVLTAHALADDSFADLEPVAYMKKPVKLTELLGEIARHCRPRAA